MLSPHLQRPRQKRISLLGTHVGYIIYLILLNWTVTCGLELELNYTILNYFFVEKAMHSKPKNPEFKGFS